MIVADFSMNNGRENRNNGNQEKGKKEKEALRKSVRSQKGGRQKRPLSFYAEVRAWDYQSPGFGAVTAGFGTRFS
jgi:hypothetical protein